MSGREHSATHDTRHQYKHIHTGRTIADSELKTNGGQPFLYRSLLQCFGRKNVAARFQSGAGIGGYRGEEGRERGK